MWVDVVLLEESGFGAALAVGGDEGARGELQELHRDRLKKMVRMRLNPRLQRRIDDSDVLQDA